MMQTQGGACPQAPLPTAAVPPLPQWPVTATSATAEPQAPLPATAVPPVPQMPLPALPEPPQTTGGGLPFQERPSQQEQPQIVMTNADGESGAVYMNFEGPIRQSVCIPPFQTVTIQLVTGEYTFTLWGDASHLQTGYAVFRRRHQYEAVWCTVHRSPYDPEEPLRLGDVE